MHRRMSSWSPFRKPARRGRKWCVNTYESTPVTVGINIMTRRVSYKNETLF